MEAKAPHETLYRWLLAIGVCALLMFFFSPSWVAFRAWARVPEMGFLVETRRGIAVLEQVAHPGRAISDTLHSAIQWRLLFPVIGKVLGLPVPVFFGLAHAGCVLVLGFIITVLRRRGAGWFEAALAAVVLGAASWYFASMCWLGYFDSWLVLGLLIVAFGRSSWSVWLACLWAPWVDERFVLGAPLAMLCRYLLRAKDAKDEPLMMVLKREFAVPAALLAGFVVVRLGVLAGASMPGATVSGYFKMVDFGQPSVGKVLLGVWEGLRAGWVLVMLAVMLLARARWLLLGVTLGVMAVGLATAQDFSRSMMLVLPVGLLGAVRALEARPRWLPGALRASAVVALLLPGHLVVSNYAAPVRSFYYELAALDNPPAVLQPELYELRAIHGMQQGLLEPAERDLTMAIKLSDHPAGPSKQRGVLYASAGRWADARRDFETMVKDEPENPESWFFRAQAELALGETAAARADMQQAATVGPADWSKRPDVARFLARLAQAK